MVFLGISDILERRLLGLESLKSVFLTIEGMLGETCASTVQKKISKLKGVKSATISFTLRGGAIKYNPLEIKIENILRSIALIGYKAKLNAEEPEYYSEKICLDFLRFQLRKTKWFAIPFFVFFFVKYFLSELAQAYLTCVSLGLSFWLIYLLRNVLFYGLRGWVVENKPSLETLLFLTTTLCCALTLTQLAQAISSGYPQPLSHHFLEANSLVLFFYSLASFFLYKNLIQKNISENPYQDLLPQKAMIDAGGERHLIDKSELRKGDIVYLKGIKKVPADAVVLDGEGFVDESEMTGKKKTSHKKPGDEILAGTLIVEGNLKIQLQRTTRESVISKLNRFLHLKKIEYPHPYFKHGKFAFYMSLVLSAGCFIYWKITDASNHMAFSHALGVLYAGGMLFIAPVILSVYHHAFRLAAQKGFLFKSISDLRRFKFVKHVFFDSERFFMQPRFEVKKIKTFYSFESDCVPKIEAVCRQAEGIIWEAFHTWLQKKGPIQKLGSVEDQNAAPLGRTVCQDKNSFHLGYVDYLQEQGIKMPGRVLRWVDELHQDGYIPLILVTNGRVDGVFALAEKIRSAALRLSQYFKKKKIQVTIEAKNGKAIDPWFLSELGLDKHKKENLKEKH